MWIFYQWPIFDCAHFFPQTLQTKSLQTCTNFYFSPDELMNLIEKRIGCEIFLDKLSEVSKHEAYNRALRHPQVPKCQRSGDLVLEYSFCKFFKQQEHLVINHLTTNQSSISGDNDPLDPGKAI